MTGSSSHRGGASAQAVTPALQQGAALAKRVKGLWLACLAAIFMILAQDGLGLGIAQKVNVPSADQGSGIFTAIGRALSNGPIAITVHAALGLLLIITALSVIIRAIIAKKNAVLWISIVGFAAILAANITGARFVGSGKDIDSNVMLYASLVALACYLICLFMARNRRSTAS